MRVVSINQWLFVYNLNSTEILSLKIGTKNQDVVKMSNTAIKLVVYEDILQLPEHIIGEIINGRIETHPRPASKHALAPDLAGWKKMPIYAHQGVSHFWLFDPQLQTLEVYEFYKEQWILLETIDNDKQVSIAPFQEISFSLSSLWSE